MRSVRSNIAIALAFGVLVTGVASTADGQQPPVYGSQLMTEQERLQYQERMRAAGSEEEREQIRSEHHAQMQERAKEMGVTLPGEPPARGMGQGMRPGQGAGSRGAGQGDGAGGRGN